MGITHIEYVAGLLLFKKILGLYILGMIVVGIPMAALSRNIWLYPKEWTVLGKILFPDMDIPNDIKNYEAHKKDNPFYEPSASAMIFQSVHLTETEKMPMVRYTLLQMIIWPFRLGYLIWLWGFALFVWTTRKLLF